MGFEPTVSAGERLQTYALDRAAAETGLIFGGEYKLWNSLVCYDLNPV